MKPVSSELQDLGWFQGGMWGGRGAGEPLELIAVFLMG